MNMHQFRLVSIRFFNFNFEDLVLEGLYKRQVFFISQVLLILCSLQSFILVSLAAFAHFGCKQRQVETAKTSPRSKDCFDTTFAGYQLFGFPWRLRPLFQDFICEKYSKIVFDFLNYLETTHPVILSHVGKEKGRCISASQTNQDQSSFM